MLMIMLMMIKSLKCPTLTKEATCYRYTFSVHHIHVQRKMSMDIQPIYTCTSKSDSHFYHNIKFEIKIYHQSSD